MQKPAIFGNMSLRKGENEQNFKKSKKKKKKKKGAIVSRRCAIVITRSGGGSASETGDDRTDASHGETDTEMGTVRI